MSRVAAKKGNIIIAPVTRACGGRMRMWKQQQAGGGRGKEGMEGGGGGRGKRRVKGRDERIEFQEI